MDANKYQVLAADTMQFSQNSQEALSIILLGLSGEVGELLTEYKKKLRDGDNYKIFRDKIIEELGDIFWYISAIATLESIELDEVLNKNAKKIKERRGDPANQQLELEEEFPDDGLLENEQLPREFVAKFREQIAENGEKCTSVEVNGEVFGENLRDNAYEDDYYRFHDVFHFSYATTLGWSPIVRKFLDKKRKTDSICDEVEDGGRACVIDEAISILVFEHARNHNFYEDATVIDYQLLRTIKMLTRHLEIKNCTEKQWEHAILMGFGAWHKLIKYKGGRIICNMYDKSMTFEKMD